MAGPASPRYRLAASGAWLAAVWATTHWYSWQRTVDLLFGSDVPEYERVARAAPGFTDTPLPSQHADRFVPHYLVGLASDAFQVGDRLVYYVVAFVLLGLMVFLVDRLIAPFGLRRLEYAVAIGALIANPYLFRFLAICPGRLADSVFMLGGLVALLGLLRGNPWLLVGGLAAATLGRSEAVFPLVVLAPIGVLVSRDWRAKPQRRRVGTAVCAFAVPLAVYGLVRLADHTFSVRDHPGFFGLTIFGTFRDLPHGSGRLGLHVARIVVGIAGALAVLLGAMAARRLGRYSALPFPFWAALAAGLARIRRGLPPQPEMDQRKRASARGARCRVLRSRGGGSARIPRRRPLGPRADRGPRRARSAGRDVAQPPVRRDHTGLDTRSVRRAHRCRRHRGRGGDRPRREG